jgi:hypothetical protein
MIYYTDPKAALFQMDGVPFEHNHSDFNLVYHAGQVLRTGVISARTEFGPNLIPNAGLEEGEIGKGPKGWSIAKFQDDGTQVRVVNDQAHERACSALIEPGKMASEQKSAKTVYLTLGSVPFHRGKTYRLSMWMKCEGKSVPVELSVYSWKKEYSWVVQSTAALTPEWRQHELLFRLPGEGDAEYTPGMDRLMWRINFPSGSARFWLDDASLREAVLSNEWEGWQAKGMDKHSIVGDPLFVDPAHDDYRLKPQSPALKLGFKPIPFEKIWPYKDDLRASWPIVEAPGAREAGRSH